MPRDIEKLEIVKKTKTSRAFNKMCVHYGIDKAPNYNKYFAQYADLVSVTARSLYFIISLNPLDYLTMSIGKSWNSCHSIVGNNGYSGGASAGCMSYMLDESSIITFVIDKIDGEIHNEGKIYRQMFYYNDNLFVQSRLYPQGNDGATNLYEKFRDLMQDEFSEMLGLTENKWTYENGTDKVKKYSDNVGYHYKDALYHGQCGIFYPSEKKSATKTGHKIHVGSIAICPCCGKEQNTHGNRLTHFDCKI